MTIYAGQRIHFYSRERRLYYKTDLIQYWLSWNLVCFEHEIKHDTGYPLEVTLRHAPPRPALPRLVIVATPVKLLQGFCSISSILNGNCIKFLEKRFNNIWEKLTERKTCSWKLHWSFVSTANLITHKLCVSFLWNSVPFGGLYNKLWSEPTNLHASGSKQGNRI